MIAQANENQDDGRDEASGLMVEFGGLRLFDPDVETNEFLEFRDGGEIALVGDLGDGLRELYVFSLGSAANVHRLADFLMNVVQPNL